MTSILIVDDSPIDRRLVAGLLGHVGDWELRLANDGGSALVQMMEKLPDIIITDLQMPELSGVELVAAVRRKFPQLPVILMTSQGSEEIAVQALRAGAASYVPKRVLSTELLPTVRRVLTQAVEDRFQSDLMNLLQSRSEHFRLGNDLNTLMSMSRYLQHQIGEAWSLPKGERLRLGTAFEEALLNAFYHGNLEVSSDLKDADHAGFYELAQARQQQSPYCHRSIDITFELTAREMSVRIRDQGQGFNPATLPDPRDLENLDRPYGRGVMLMRSFMDAVNYSPSGNEVTLRKRRFAQDDELPTGDNL